MKLYHLKRLSQTDGNYYHANTEADLDTLDNDDKDSRKLSFNENKDRGALFRSETQRPTYLQYNRKMSTASDRKVEEGSQAQAPVMANIDQ